VGDSFAERWNFYVFVQRLTFLGKIIEKVTKFIKKHPQLIK
jgi:hypothetical protein